jgi:multiple sugar transport system permease protein
MHFTLNPVAASKRLAGTAAKYAFLFSLSCLFIMPLVWMISTSLKPNQGLFVFPVEWIPKDPQWNNYLRVFQRVDFSGYIVNTLITSLLPVVGTLIATPMVAYSITMIPWKGAKYIFPLILATMMIPGQVTQIPMYITWSKMGFLNTYVPLILPYFFGTPYYIYLMRQFMKSLPHSLVEAARIDGANDLRILVNIIYPLCMPVLTTIGVLVFIGCWNNLEGPLIYLQDSAKYTIAVGLKSFMLSAKQDWELLMAANTIFTLPLVVIFFLAQKQFLSGISTTSGLK